MVELASQESTFLNVIRQRRRVFFSNRQRPSLMSREVFACHRRPAVMRIVAVITRPRANCKILKHLAARDAVKHAPPDLRRDRFRLDRGRSPARLPCRAGLRASWLPSLPAFAHVPSSGSSGSTRIAHFFDVHIVRRCTISGHWGGRLCHEKLICPASLLPANSVDPGGLPFAPMFVSRGDGLSRLPLRIVWESSSLDPVPSLTPFILMSPAMPSL
jgi:hypothetical protein